jgi:tRNA-specific 2-thiouridylase
MKQGADYIATGHYAGLSEGALQRGEDARKDQSYFLYTLNKHQLGHALFPLSGLRKDEVREKAATLDLPTATKKDSQGICFIGHLDLKKFLMEQLGTKPGKTYYLPPVLPDESFQGRVQRALVVGEHRGSMFYTIGERAGEAIDNGVLAYYTNDQDTRPVYVVATEATSNRIFISTDPTDPHLFSASMVVESFQMTGGEPGSNELSTLVALVREGRITCQARYQQAPVLVHSITSQNSLLTIDTDPIRGVAPGQSLVLYEGDRVWGGGIVCATEHTIQSGSSPA